MKNLSINSQHLLTHEPIGEESVRFQRKMAVPITPTSSFYTLFLSDKSNDFFMKEVNAEKTRLNNLQELKDGSSGNDTSVPFDTMNTDEPCTAEALIDYISSYQSKFTNDFNLSVEAVPFKSIADMNAKYDELISACNKILHLERGRRKGISPQSKDICNKLNEFKKCIQPPGSIPSTEGGVIDMIKDDWLSQDKFNQLITLSINTTATIQVSIKKVLSIVGDGNFNSANFSLSWDYASAEDKQRASDFVVALNNRVELLSSQAEGFLGQTEAVLLDERINDWYRSYKAAKDDEDFYKGMIHYYENNRSAALGLQPNDTPAVMPLPFPGGYKASTEDVSFDSHISKLKEIVSIEDQRDQLHNELYRARDIKKSLLREIRLAGYSLIDEPKSIHPSIKELGYDFVITKGTPEYEDIGMVDYDKIITGTDTADATDLKSILKDNDSALEFGNIKTFLETEKVWANIIGTENKSEQNPPTSMTGWAITEAWPRSLRESMLEQAKKLYKQDKQSIPDTLGKEKQEEAFLLESIKSNTWFGGISSAEDGLPLVVTTNGTESKDWLERKKRYEGKRDSWQAASNKLLGIIPYIRGIKQAEANPRHSFLLKIETEDEGNEYYKKRLMESLDWESAKKYFEKLKSEFSQYDDDGVVKDRSILKMACLNGVGEIGSYTSYGKKAYTAYSINKGSYTAYQRTTVTHLVDTAPPQLVLFIENDYDKQIDWRGRDYMIITKNDNNKFIVSSGRFDDNTESGALNSADVANREEIVDVFLQFIEGCRELSMSMKKHYDDELGKLQTESNKLQAKFEKDKNTLDGLQRYALTRARISFLLHWKSPGTFSPVSFERVGNPLIPDSDPWTDFIKKLEPQQVYNPWGRQVQIDHFYFQRNGYYTQDGLSMRAYLELIKGDDSTKAMRVAVFPVLDEYGLEVDNVRRAVINPVASYVINPINKLPAIRFIEQHIARVQWQGVCLGELSHTENLAPNETKTIKIEKKTNFKQKLSSTYGEENTASVKSTTSFEDKLSSELNNKVSYEEEETRKLEDKKESEQRNKSVVTKDRKEVSASKFSVDAKFKGIGAKISTSKDITKNRNDTRTNENILKDSSLLTTNNATKQGRETQKKDVFEKIKKGSTETSNTNKVNIKKVSESETNTSDSYTEEINLINSNVGKTINYNFYQLQNVYKTVLSIEDVKIIINPGHEIIAKSGMTDVRVFHITDLANLYDELSGNDNYSVKFLLYVVLEYINENYYFKNKEGLIIESGNDTDHNSNLLADALSGAMADAPLGEKLQEIIDALQDKSSAVWVEKLQEIIDAEDDSTKIGKLQEIRDAEDDSTKIEKLQEIMVALQDKSSAVWVKKLDEIIESLHTIIAPLSFSFKPIVTNTPDGESDIYTINSGGLYMDSELGKQMATESYLEDRRDIETSLKRAEVEHLNAKTKAGVFYPSPNITPAAGGLLSKLWPSSKEKQIATADGETNTKVSA